jgi:beta-glucosidase
MSTPGDTMIPLFGNSYWMYELSRAGLNASVPMDRINDMATRVVAAWIQMGQNSPEYPAPNFSSNTADRVGPLHPAALISPSGVVNQYVDVRGDHAQVAREVAQDAITLLKNDGNLLPLNTTARISVFGTDAAVNPNGANACADRNCNVGTLGMGWGSGTANYETFDDPISALRRNVANVTFYNTDNFPSVPTPGPDDVAIVFINSDSGENQYTVEGNHGDRDASGLSAWHGGDKLVQETAKRYSNVVVVVHTVGPLVLEPWISLPSVKSVLFAHLPGQEAGESLTNVLFGKVSPSGHLPYSIPVKESDYPSSVTNLVGFAFAAQPQDTYSEGLYIDYRALNKAGIKPRFAFGHGLSYTSFNYSASIRTVTPLTEVPPPRPAKLAPPAYSKTIPPANETYWPEPFPYYVWRLLYPWLQKGEADAAARTGASIAAGSQNPYPYPQGYSTTQKPSGPPAGGAQGGNPALWDVAFEVDVVVGNTGARPGRAVAQGYVQFPGGSPETPVIQLRDFAKTRELAPGESQTVTLKLTRKALSVWDTARQDWVVPVVGGRYTIWIGGGSDILGVACYTDAGSCEGGLKGPV